MSAPATATATRKGDRVSISIAVRVSATDASGQHFTDVVQTVNVSRNGCCLVTKKSLVPGQKIYLRRLGSEEEAVGRLVGQVGLRDDGNLYGIEVLNPGDSFWGIRFPPQKELEQGAVRILLQCSGCKSCEEVALNEVDLSVFQITHRLTRRCQTCGNNSMWETVPDGRSGSDASGTSVKKAEKRRHPRISMRTTGCIGPVGLNADVVDVMNVSRGGVCFRSVRVYPQDTWVQVAVPYTANAANIFVAGRIVRSRKLIDGLVEYGVEYVKT